jgi:hypothetical protein
MPAVRPHRARPACLPFLLLLGGLTVLLGGCSTHSNATPGTPVVTMSGTNTGFASYLIDIDGITLTRDDKTVVTPLYVAETVDLAALANGTELVEAPAVPAGTYVSGTVILDFSVASIWYQANGQAIPMLPYGQDGTQLTGQSILTITFDPAHPLVVTNQQAVRLAVNFDLAAMNTVTDITSTPTGKVTVRPFATMSPVTVDYQPLRVRGLFVVKQDGNFILNIRPFYDQSSALGGIQVNVNDQTYYNVDQQVFTGAPGLDAIGGLQISQPVAAYGTLGSLNSITPQFNATQVYGSVSQESYAQDHIVGVLASRAGNTMTIRGARVFSPPTLYGTFVVGGTLYNNAVLTVDPTTVVTEDGNAVAGLGLQSLSVGQVVDASGRITTFGTAAPAVPQLNATGLNTGMVRMQRTDVWGLLKSASAGSASLDVLRLGGYDPAGLNFGGTATGGGAVDPSDYAVNTGAATATGSEVLAQGFVTPFGSAPPAFDASQLTADTAYPQQQLVVEWTNGGAAQPFSSQTAAGLVVDLANADLTDTHAITTGATAINLTSLPASPLITTTGANQQALTLAVGNATLTSGISIFNSAAAYSTALTSTLNGTNKVYRLVAVGQYNAASNTFVAQNISVSLWE